jgi:phosphate transport system substrate-binding protein
MRQCASRLWPPTVCLLLLLSACAPQPLAVTRAPVTLRLVTADSCQPLGEAIAGAYEESHPWVTVQIQVHDAALAEQTLREGNADVAILSWIGESEGLWSRPVARDGVAVIVHPDMPLTEIDLGLLQEIYRGRVQEWEGMVLAVVSREEGSGTRAAFDDAVLQGRDITLTAVVMVSSEAVVEYVALTPGSIGYVSTLQLGDPAASGVRVLPVEGISPTSAAIDDGSYALSRPLYLATASEPTGEAREFAQWVLGPKGQAVVSETLNQLRTPHSAP